MSLRARQADVREVPDPLLQAPAARAGAGNHALCRSAHDAAPPLAEPDSFRRQAAASRASNGSPAQTATAGPAGLGSSRPFGPLLRGATAARVVEQEAIARTPLQRFTLAP